MTSVPTISPDCTGKLVEENTLIPVPCFRHVGEHAKKPIRASEPSSLQKFAAPRFGSRDRER